MNSATKSRRASYLRRLSISLIRERCDRKNALIAEWWGAIIDYSIVGKYHFVTRDRFLEEGAELDVGMDNLVSAMLTFDRMERKA